MAGIAVAILTCTFAWFSSNNVTVKANSATFIAAPMSTFVISATAPDANYSRYMGETGLQYEGEDSPYHIEYNPFVVNVSMITADIGRYFTYELMPTSCVIPAVSALETHYMTEDELWNNFSMELHPLDIDPVTGYMSDSGVIYRSENGYFRNIATNEFLLLNDEELYFDLYIIFQGDVPYQILQTTMLDLDEEYMFDFCDEKYMFANFYLQALFNLEPMHTLTFRDCGYDKDDSYSEIGSPYVALHNEPIYFSGMSMYAGDGTLQFWPTAELRNGNTAEIATEYYFIDWADVEFNESTNSRQYYIYRSESTTSGIYTLAVRPLREDSESLYAIWGESPKVTLNYNYEELEDVEIYLRKDSGYYTSAGYLSFNYNTKGISVNNPVVNAPDAGATIRTTGYGAPAREGYIFEGWSATPEASYSSSGDLNDVFDDDGEYYTDEDVTLYGVWKQVFNVTISFETAWGNYATINNIVLTKGTTNYHISGGTFTLKLERGKGLYDLLSGYTATGVANLSGNTTRNLTLEGFYYWNGSSYTKLSSSYNLTLNEDTTLYMRWNERKTYTVYIDLYQKWKAVLTNYSLTAKMSITSAKIIDTYVITYNGSTTGTFVGSSSSNLTIANIPEGCRLSDVVNTPSADSATGGYIAALYDFDCFSILDNEWESSSTQALKNRVEEAHNSTNKVETSSVFNDALIARLSANKIYVFFDR